MNRTSLIRYLYVNSSKVQEIKKLAEGKSTWQQIKAELKIGQFIMSQGYKDSKIDIAYYYQHFNKDLTPQQSSRTYKILNDIWKVPPIAILFWFPGGLPIVLAYMAFLPALTPSWFLLDSYQQKMEKLKKQRQLQSLKYFINCGSINISKIQGQIHVSTLINLNVYNNMNFLQQKKIHELCFGQTFDGTEIIYRTFNIKLNSFISPTISSYLLKKNLTRRLEGQQNSQNQQHDKLSFKIIKEATQIVKYNQKQFSDQIKF